MTTQLIPLTESKPTTARQKIARQQYSAPKLSWLSVAWRYGLCALWYAITLFAVAASDQPWTWRAPADLVVGLIMFVVIRFRRRYPLGVAVVLAVMSAFSTSGFLVALWGYVSLCARRRPKAIAIALVALVGSHVLYVLADPVARSAWVRQPDQSLEQYRTQVIANAVAFVAVVVIATVWGLYVGASRDLVASLRERAETAEREQELRVLQGQAAERNRIAREMHDVLAHRMTLVSMHAGALAYRTDLDPEAVRDVAAVIQTNAHLGLEELRTVLVGLRADSGEGEKPEKPQPTVAQIATLIDEARAVGQNVDLTDEVVSSELLPTQTGRHAYRMIQEGLTNARKHAPNARVTVRMSGAPGSGLTVRVANPINNRGGQVPGAKVGLIGLGERAHIAGGRFHHGHDGDGNFVLDIWLPW